MPYPKSLSMLAGRLWVRLADKRRDNSRSLPLPGWLETFIARDPVAYRLHAGVGTLLTWVGAPSTVVASEWRKAALHARSTREIDTAARNLAAAQFGRQ
jgi:hypothetical protein